MISKYISFDYFTIIKYYVREKNGKASLEEYSIFITIKMIFLRLINKCVICYLVWSNFLSTLTFSCDLNYNHIITILFISTS